MTNENNSRYMTVAQMKETRNRIITKNKTNAQMATFNVKPIPFYVHEICKLVGWAYRRRAEILAEEEKAGNAAYEEGAS